MAYDKNTVRKLLDQAKAAGRSALTAPEAKTLCEAYGIAVPRAYDVKGATALSSQSGGIGMAIVGFSRSTKMGVSAIVGLGNKSDIDEDDLLTFFEQDNNTQIICQHLEDLKDGRSSSYHMLLRG